MSFLSARQNRYFPSSLEMHSTNYFLFPALWKLEMRKFRGGVKSQRAELQTTENYSQVLKPNGIYPIGFDII